jgi:hypothetical protein
MSFRGEGRYEEMNEKRGKWQKKLRKKEKRSI